MIYNIIISEEARNDEIASYHYYELQRVGLGDEFLKSMENCYKVIEEHPHYFSFIDNHKLLRDAKVKRFPFVIIFEISGNNIFVYSVHHTRRIPYNNK